MGQKKGADYFAGVNAMPFDLFIAEYSKALVEFNEMMAKVCSAIQAGENPSKNHLYKMRGKTIDIEKFGKQFRERTVVMEKAE